MQKTFTKILILTIILTAALSVNYIFAVWVGPTQAPTGGNTSTPIHVGTTDQLKNGGLSLGKLSVWGGAYFNGSVGIGAVSPSEKLDVVGNIIASGTICDSNGCIGDDGGGGGHSDGLNCTVGQTPTGVDANGNVQGCFIPNNIGALSCTTATGNTIASCPSSYTLTGGGCAGGTGWPNGNGWRCTGTGKSSTAYARCCKIQ